MERRFDLRRDLRRRVCLARFWRPALSRKRQRPISHSYFRSIFAEAIPKQRGWNFRLDAFRPETKAGVGVFGPGHGEVRVAQPLVALVIRAEAIRHGTQRPRKPERQQNDGEHQQQQDRAGSHIQSFVPPRHGDCRDESRRHSLTSIASKW